MMKKEAIIFLHIRVLISSWTGIYLLRCCICRMGDTHIPRE